MSFASGTVTPPFFVFEPGFPVTITILGIIFMVG